jgi:hypothetical protein
MEAIEAMSARLRTVSDAWAARCNELRSQVQVLQLKAERLQVVIDACDVYHGRVLAAFVKAFEVAMRNATGKEREELQALRRTIL